jgi:hypothetical protein
LINGLQIGGRFNAANVLLYAAFIANFKQLNTNKMKITLPLVSPGFDDNRLSEKVKEDFDKGCQIYIYKDEKSWEGDEESHAFALWIEYGKDNENSLMFDADLNDLEMFANSLLKSIEMLRRDYSDVLKEKIKNGSLL